MWRGWWLPIFTLATLATATARAQDDTAAEIHFRAGRAFLERGRYQEACREFAASMRAAPSVGAQLNLGLCNEKLERLATAQRAYLDGARMAAAQGETARADGARERAKALEPRIPRLRIRLLEPIRPGTTVDVDEKRLSPQALDEARLVDPGEHRVVVRAPGASPWSQVVQTTEGGVVVTIDVPALEPLRAAPVRQPERDTAMRTAGIVALGGGVLGLAIGAVFGVLAMEDRDRAASDAMLCHPENLCSNDGEALIEGARVKARIATAAFVVGGAVTAGGVALIVVHEAEGERTTAQLSVQPFGASIQLAF